MKAKKRKGSRRITASKKRRVIYKQGPLGRKDLRRLRLYLNGSKRCQCPALDDAFSKKSQKKKKGRKNKPYFLVMGRKKGRKFVINVLHNWPKRSRVLRKASRNHFGSSNCPDFGSVNASWWVWFIHETWRAVRGTDVISLLTHDHPTVLYWARFVTYM